MGNNIESNEQIETQYSMKLLIATCYLQVRIYNEQIENCSSDVPFSVM